MKMKNNNNIINNNNKDNKNIACPETFLKQLFPPRARVGYDWKVLNKERNAKLAINKRYIADNRD